MADAAPSLEASLPDEWRTWLADVQRHFVAVVSVLVLYHVRDAEATLTAVQAAALQMAQQTASAGGTQDAA